MNLEQFRDHLAASIGIKGEGNTLSADRANYLETIISGCHAELEQLGVATWTLDDIPDFTLRSLTIYCRSALDKFGFDPDPALNAVGLMQLRYLTTDSRSGVGKAEYF